MDAYFWWNFWLLAGVVGIGALVAFGAHWIRRRHKPRPSRRRTAR